MLDTRCRKTIWANTSWASPCDAQGQALEVNSTQQQDKMDFGSLLQHSHREGRVRMLDIAITSAAETSSRSLALHHQ